MNFGAQDVFGTYSPARVRAGLDDLTSRGITRIRVGIPSYTNSQGIINARGLCRVAKDRGFYVIYGSSSNDVDLSTSNIQTYKDAVIAEAAYCQEHNLCDEFQVGNEEEFHHDNTLTHMQVIGHIKQLATSVKAVFSGVVSYSFAESVRDLWMAAGKGNLDRIGMNTYGNGQHDTHGFRRALVQAKNALGGLFVSEFNIHWDWKQVQLSEQEVAEELSRRLRILKDVGIEEAYYFTYSTHNDEHAALLKNGEHHSLWCSFFTGRRWLV